MMIGISDIHEYDNDNYWMRYQIVIRNLVIYGTRKDKAYIHTRVEQSHPALQLLEQY